MTRIHGVELISDRDMVVLAARKGPFEPESFLVWHNCLQPGAVVVDVGAYTGLYAMYAAKHGASVYAFEPHPANYQRLVENMSANWCGGINAGRMSVFNAAVGAECGRCAMVDLESRPPLTSAGKTEAAPDGPVELLTLDSLNLPRCDAIKIDVEGGELAVLRGAARTIAGFLPRLIIEANTEVEREALDRELSQYGYRAGVRADVRNLIYVHTDR